MQLKITNHSTVQVPLLVVRGGRWHSELMMPGIERLILGADVTEVKMGRVSLGAEPADPDSKAAKINYENGIDAMLGRDDGPAVLTPIPVLIESFEGDVSIVDGASTTTTIKAKEGGKMVILSDAGALTPAA